MVSRSSQLSRWLLHNSTYSHNAWTPLGQSVKWWSSVPMECTLQVVVCDGGAAGGLRAATKRKQHSSCAHRANKSQRVISMMAPLVSDEVRTAALDTLSALSAQRHLWDSSPRGETPSA